MVFEPAAAPSSDRAAFMRWYEQQTEWPESHGYGDPNVSSPSLRAWFSDMSSDYPPVNPPSSHGNPDNPRVTDYTIGRVMIYAAFAWSEMNPVIQRTFLAAQRHKVGFFHVSAPGQDIWLPNPKTGRLKTAFR